MDKAVAGDLSLLGLPEFLQILAFHHRTVRIGFEPAGPGAELTLWDGRLAAARCGTAQGAEAFFLILASNWERFILCDASGTGEGEDPVPAGDALPLGPLLLQAAARGCGGGKERSGAGAEVAGSTALLSVQEMLQVFELNRSSSRLRIEGNGIEILLAEGAVASAVTTDARNDEAVYQALLHPPAPFHLAVAGEDLPRPERLWQIPSLLMEGLRRRDETLLIRRETGAEENEHARETLAALAAGRLAPSERCELARRYLPGGAVAPASVLVPLAIDEDPEVRAEALRSIEALPAPVIGAFANDPGTPPPLLRYLYERNAWGSDLRSVLLANPSLPLAPVAAAAAQLGAEELSALETRTEWLSDSVLAAALREHPLCTFREKLTSASAPKRLRTVSFDGVASASAAPAVPSGLVLEEPVDDPRLVKAERRPTIGDLLMVAIKGTLREKLALVQHPDDNVAVTVIKTPGLPDVAIEMIAENTSANPAVLKEIAANGRWRAMGKVARALLFNPKTPVAASRSFIPALRSEMLEKIAGNRDLPDGLRQLARQQLDKKKQK